MQWLKMQVLLQNMQYLRVEFHANFSLLTNRGFLKAEYHVKTQPAYKEAAVFHCRKCKKNEAEKPAPQIKAQGFTARRQRSK
jgi:hypothetical protein